MLLDLIAFACKAHCFVIAFGFLPLSRFFQGLRINWNSLSLEDRDTDFSFFRDSCKNWWKSWHLYFYTDVIPGGKISVEIKYDFFRTLLIVGEMELDRCKEGFTGHRLLKCGLGSGGVEGGVVSLQSPGGVPRGESPGKFRISTVPKTPDLLTLVLLECTK